MTRRYDQHRIGEYRIGYSRIGVVNPIFERKIERGLTVEVTRRKRIVGTSRDSVTGAPDITWEESTIDVILTFGPSDELDLPAGGVGVLDGVIETVDPLELEDRFVFKKTRYKVVGPMQPDYGRFGGFLCRRAGFRKVELEEAI